MTNISGDGNRAIVGSSEGGAYTIIYDLNSYNEIDILEDAAYPVLDYDGSRIAFYSNANLTGQNADGSYELYLWDTGVLSQLSNFSAADAVSFSPPDISANGNKIVFAVSPTGWDGLSDFGDTITFYIWEEGSGVRRLITADTINFGYSPIKMSADGTKVVFWHDGNLTNNDPQNLGGLYRIDLQTQQITHILNLSENAGFMQGIEFMSVDADASRIAFNTTDNLQNLNPNHTVSIYVWDQSTGLKILNSGSLGTAIIPDAIPIGFSDDGNSLLFESAFNPTGENADGSIEYFMFQWPNTIRQISSRTGVIYFSFTTEGLSADASRAAITLPVAEDIDPYNGMPDVELFLADCDPSKGVTAPSSLRTTSVSRTSINLAWNDNASNETGYRLERSTNNGSTWTEIAALGANTTSYSDSGLSCNTNYQYRVQAYRSDTYRYAYSNTISVTTSICGVLTPSNLRATGVSYNSIALAWTDNATNESSYYVERRDTNGNWLEIATLSANSIYFANLGLTCGTSYDYRVRAYSNTLKEYSSYSAVLTVNSGSCSPLAPSQLRVTGTSPATVSFAWLDNSPDESGFSLERSLDGITWAEVGTANANATSYTDTSANCETNYSYRLRSYRAASSGYSSYTPVVTATTMECAMPAPSNLNMLSRSISTITLVWTDNSIDESNFVLERSADAGANWTEIASVTANTSSYTDSNLACGASYLYRLRSYRTVSDNYSDYSTILEASPYACDIAPANLRLNYIARDYTSAGNIFLTWDALPGINSYQIERSYDNGANWTEIGTVSKTSTIYRTLATMCSLTYQYRVRAFFSQDNSYSAYSNIYTFSCPPVTITSFQATDAASTSLQLNWTTSADNSLNKYLELSTDGANWQSASGWYSQGSDGTLANLACDTTYYLRLSIYFDAQYTSSDVISAATLPCTLPSLADFTVTSTLTSITMSWTDNIDDETSYEVEALQNNRWVLVDTLPANTTSYQINANCSRVYNYRIRAYRASDENHSPYTDTPVYARLCTPAFTSSSAPTSYNVSLVWTVSEAAAVSNYEIERSTDQLTWTVIGINPGTTKGYIDNTVACATSYYYRVRSYRSADDSYSDYTAIKALTTANCILVAPYNFSVSSQSTTSTTFSWQDANTDESYFVLESSLDGASWTDIYHSYGNRSLSNYTLGCNSDQFFRVKAYRSHDAAYSEASNTLNVNISACPPLSPSNFHVNFDNVAMNLAWNDNATDEDNYLIYRDNVLIATLDANQSSYVDSPDTSCNRRYVYTVTAYRNSDGMSSTATALDFTNLCPIVLSASSTSLSSINLSWLWEPNLAFGYPTYRLQRSTDNGVSWTYLTDTSGNSYTNTSLACGTSFQYRVQAQVNNYVPYGDFSNVVTQSTLDCAPVAPTNLSLVAVNASSIDISWTDNASDETSYSLERSVNNSTWQQLATLPADSSSYSNSSVSCSTNYRYRVRAYRTSGAVYSAYSNILSVNSQFCAPPAAPTNLRVSATSYNSVSLAWTDVATNESDYRIERSNDGGSSWTELDILLANSSTYTNSAVACETAYLYRVRNRRASDNQYSDYSNTVAAITAYCLPFVPSNLSIVTITDSSINLAWVDNAVDESGYRLERSANNGSSWTEIAQLAVNSSGYSDTSITCSSNYQYRVRAYRAGDSSYSLYSNIVSASSILCPPPATPTNLIAGSILKYSVALSWTDNASNETAYYLERSDDNGSTWSPVVSLNANSKNYMNSGLSCETSYQYRVRAYRYGDNQYSGYSNVVSITTLLCPSPAPTDLLLLGTSASSIDMAWTDNASDETSYSLERYEPYYGWKQIAELAANSAAYNDTIFNCNVSYQYRVRAYRSSDTTYSAYSNTITASSSVCPPPPAPTNLEVTSQSSNYVNLAWTDNATDEAGYRLEFSSDNGITWSEIAQLAANIKTYKHTGLVCDTSYQYRVRAYRNYEPSLSDYSNILSFTSSSCVLAAPGNLRVTANTLYSISLVWDDNAPDDNKVLIERSTDASNWTSVGSVNLPANTYTSSSLLCDTTYYYRVRALRTSDSLYSDYSSVLSASTSDCPAAPTGLYVVGTPSRTAINIAWTDNAADETRYMVYRAYTGLSASWSLVATLGADTNSYSDAGLTCNKAFQYRVRAYRSTDNTYSSYSNVISTATAACLIEAPSNLIVTGTTTTTVSLRWTDNSVTENSFIVEESSDGILFTGTGYPYPSTNATSYTHLGLLCNSNHYYRVAAYSSTEQGYSAYSNTIVARTVACSFPAPSNLLAGTTTATSITFSWTDNASNESNYRIERSTDGISWTEIAQVNANIVTYTNNTGLSCNTSYSFRVRGYRSSDAGYSAYSNVLTVNTAACPALLAPSGLILTANSNATINLAWTDNDNTETSYRVERSANNGSTWTEIAQLAANSTSYSNTGLSCHTSYQYRVRVYRSNDNSYSPYSNILSTATSLCPPPPAPTGLATSLVTSTTINLAWVDNASNETGYRVERSSDAGSTWTEIAQLAGNNVAYSNSGLICETNYQYRVRAYRATDNQFSDYSNTLTAITSACPVSNPGNLTATVSQFSLLLSWVDNSTNETDFELQRQNSGVWQTITTLPSNSIGFSDTALLCQTSYSYRLRAYNANTGVYSGWTSLSTLTATCPPLVAATLSSTNSETSINLSWTGDSTAQSFTLSYNNSGQWLNLGTFNTSSGTYTHIGLACNRNYQYRIQSSRQQDNATLDSSSYSFSTAVCPPLNAPAAPVVLNTTNNMISLQIPALPTGANNIRLERSTDGINWLGLGVVSSNYLDVNVICGTVYQYRLVAYRASDASSSAPSAVSYATTQACPVYVSNIVGVYRAGTWSFADSNASANPASNFNFGDASWQPLVGDWDGDGVDGIGLYRNGEFVLRSIVDAQLKESRFNFGNAEAGWQAVAGDWNGDGIDSIGLYGNGQIILSNDNNNFDYRFNLGDGTGWLAVAGDWDGNGADGVAIYQNGFWLLIDNPINPSNQRISYGPEQAGWLPVAGDWDADGIDTIGLYNNGLWRIRIHSNVDGAEMSINFGLSGDIPLSIYEGGIPSGEFAQDAITQPNPNPLPEITPEVTANP